MSSTSACSAASSGLPASSIRRATLADMDYIKPIALACYPGRDIEQGRQWMRFVITSPERLVLLAPGAVGVAQVFWRYGFERKARLDMLAALPGSGLSTLKMLRIMLEWAKANGAARFNLDADTGVDFAAFSKRLGGTPVTTTTYEIPLR